MNPKIFLVGIVLSVVLGAIFGLVGFTTGYITSIYVIVSAVIVGYAITLLEREKVLTDVEMIITAIVYGAINFVTMYLTIYITALNSLPVFMRGDLTAFFLSNLDFIDLVIFFISIVTLYQVLRQNEKKKLERQGSK